MPTYTFKLENSTGVVGHADVREMADDASAVREAKRAAGEVVIDEMLEERAMPVATVTVARDDQIVAIVRVRADVDLFSR